jgi:nucleoside-diphosphate-sugar epimerase
VDALVIGGTRFVGLRLVKRLVAKGYHVTVLNRGKTVAALPAGVQRLYADRRDAGQVYQALAGRHYDLVCDITGYQVANLEPVLSALTGQIGHYIFQSTGAVYAPTESLPSSEDAPYINADSAPAGEATYALEKVACERYLLAQHASQGLPLTIFRSPVIYGPENWMHDREFSYFTRLELERPVLVPANRAVVLPYVYVDDLAEAYVRAAGRAETFGQAYNVAGEEALTVASFIDAVAGAMGKTANKLFLTDATERQLERPVFFFPYARSQHYSIGKARADFGFDPATDMQRGMLATYAWWRENLGVEGTRFQPGKLGFDVNFEFEDRVISRFSANGPAT